MGDMYLFKLKVVALLMAVICPCLIIDMAPLAIRQYKSYEWPEAPAVVLGTIAKTVEDDKSGILYYGRVSYMFWVDGQEYRSDLTDLGPGNKHADQRKALSDVSKHFPGEKLTVYYNPQDPSEAVISKGIPKIHMYLLIGLAITTVVCILSSVFIIRGWLRPSKNRIKQ